MSETASPTEFEEDARHHAPVIPRPADHPGHEGRFGNVTRMVFHPTPEHPNEPNAGLTRVCGSDLDIALRHGISTVAPSAVLDSSASCAFTASSNGYS